MPEDSGGLKIDAKTIVTVVSMVIAGISAFFAWQIQTAVTDLDMQQQISRLEGMPERVKNVEKNLSEITNGGKQLDVLTELLDRAIDTTGGARAKASEADTISTRAEAAAGRAEVKVEELQRQLEDASEIAKLLDGVTNLEDFLANNTAFQEKIADLAISIPPGTVAAFDTTGCPAGWTEFEEAQGRFILGVGKGPLKVAVKHRDPGGEEEHTLEPEELPLHIHGMGLIGLDGARATHGNDPKDSFLDVPWYIKGSNHLTEGFEDDAKDIMEPFGGRDGMTLPHNNMPPYIALHFCKYEG